MVAELFVKYINRNKMKSKVVPLLAGIPLGTTIGVTALLELFRNNTF